MNEQQFGYRIKLTLNQGLSLNPAVLARLAAARESALERQRISASSPLLAWANASVTEEGSGPVVSRLLVAGFLLVVGLFAVNNWHQNQQAEETVAIDAAVLTGELPIDAYLDKGFDAWLKSSSD